MRRSAEVLSGILVALVCVACDGSESPTNLPPVTQVIVSPSILELDEFEVGQFTARALIASGEEAVGRSVTWVSSRPERFSVDAQGRVAAIQAAEGSVTATVEGVVGAALIRVLPLPTADIAFSELSVSVPKGRQVQLGATAVSADGRSLPGRAIRFTGSNPSVALVRADGLVTAVSEGTLQVTAAFEGVSAEMTVTVSPEVVAAIDLTPSSLLITTGQSRGLSATLTGESGSDLTGSPIVWTSDDPGIASVTGAGVITGVALGSTQIRASSGEVSASVPVQVAQGFPVTASVRSASSSDPLAGISVEVVENGGGRETFCTTGVDGTCTGFRLSGAALAFSCSGCSVPGSGASEVIIPELQGSRVVNFEFAGAPLLIQTFDGDLEAEGWLGRGGVFAASSAEIVSDPDNPSNKVLRFGDTRAQGDLFTPPIPIRPGHTYRVSFDFRGSASRNAAGFIGLSDGYPGFHAWLAGTRLESGITFLLTDDGTWNSYSIEFDANDLLNSPADGFFHIMMEDGDGGIPRDAYFDNIVIVDIG